MVKANSNFLSELLYINIFGSTAYDCHCEENSCCLKIKIMGTRKFRPRRVKFHFRKHCSRMRVGFVFAEDIFVRPFRDCFRRRLINAGTLISYTHLPLSSKRRHSHMLQRRLANEAEESIPPVGRLCTTTVLLVSR